MKIFSSRIAQYIHFFLLLAQILGHLSQRVYAEPIKTKSISSDLDSFPNQKSQLKRASLNIKKRSTQKASNDLKRVNLSLHLDLYSNQTEPLSLHLIRSTPFQLDEKRSCLNFDIQGMWSFIY